MTAMGRPRLAVLTLALILPGIMSAQGGGRLHGTAFDSLLGRPLAGATVWLQDLNRSAFTDSIGRFVLDSVPAGRHVFLLAHPDLDSAGLGTVASAIAVARGEDVALAVPSLATFWRRLCGPAEDGADSAIVFGSVQDADSHHPLSGVTVMVVWPRLHVNDSLHVRIETLADSAKTDSTGSYRVCGVATGMNVRAQARAGPFATGIVQLMARDRPVARRDFTLSLTLQIADSGRGSGALRGRVRSEAGRPVAGAQVVIDGVDSTLSDGDGRYALVRLPGGTHSLRARAVGFSPLEAAVDLPGERTKALDLELRTITVVDTITVLATGRTARVLQELEERRRAGFGYALRQDEIQRRATLRSVMQSVPSVNVQGNGLSFTVLMLAGSITRGYCVADLRIDGMPATWDQLSSYQPQDLVAVEVYPRASLVPVRYQNISSGCGMVLVWTKYLN
jgi:carboxypeptidase family protein